MASKWKEREGDIRRMVVEEQLTDSEIAAVYGVTTSALSSARNYLGIPSAGHRGGRKYINTPAGTSGPLQSYQENGVTVTVYPPAYAEGAFTDYGRTRSKRRPRGGE